MSWKKVVAITGCDSGLGWAIAARTAREGMITIAGMYNDTNTEASQALKSVCAHTHKLDVTDPHSIAEFKNYVNNILKDNPDCKLHAVVNNAGVMTVGDFEWLTPKIIENTINVNLLGSMRVVSAFLPELRKSASSGIKPRIINVASHCGLQPLPGFAPYSASKAGILAWTRALRLEQCVNGLTAVSFIPGGFITASNIMSTQLAHAKSMMDNLSEEQKALYENKIQSLSSYLCSAANNTRYDTMKDENIIETFMKALTEDNPKEIYKVESLRYKFYYKLMKIPLPMNLHRTLIKRFLKFPINS
ncbi:D-beta-hydroxybutyrate dehydrogenase, mitochondrial [Epargyreus clarus]|uniref:D-beta-hydroxybutyrate dehydrogenase, mitochondrial n=1 Tax=Epargyreus clarus TaxID=520877 RepID=UPI003C2E02EC